MKIDCFCFSAPWLATTNYNISENDDDNTIQIKTKEQELIDFVKDKDVMIVFDRNTKKFYMVVKQIVIKKLEFFYLFFQTIILNKKGIKYINRRHIFEFVLYLVHIESELKKIEVLKENKNNNYENEDNIQLTLF